jgi:hypothetical protein
MSFSGYFICVHLRPSVVKIQGAVARPAVTARSCEYGPEIFEMAFGVMNIFSPNKVGAHNAGWPSQFRFAVSVFWSGVCDLAR